MQTFEPFFDNELIDFIVQMTNACTTETNAVGWVPVDRSDIRCFLKVLMLSGNLDPADKCSKVRPLMNMIQEKCKKFAIMTKNVNVDESMIPYYGKLGQKLKQWMPLKPIRCGYKVWCLNLWGRYLYNFEVYQGKGSKNEYADDFVFGPSVVIGLVKSLPKGNFSVLLITISIQFLWFETGKYWLYWYSEGKYVSGLSSTP